MEAACFGSMMHWLAALTVVVVSLLCKFIRRGLVSSAAILIGLVAGYVVAWAQGMVNFGCLLYTSDAADDSLRVDLGGRRIIKKTLCSVGAA